MNTSSSSEVRELYDGSVESYAQMMDTEIDLPVYRKILTGLKQRIVDLDGGLLDSSCGTGHLLALYRQEFDARRELVGMDLSSAMVEHAQSRLGDHVSIQQGDMRDLGHIKQDSLAAVVSFFAVHHLDPEEVPTTFTEWARATRVGGQIVLAAWEGSGTIDYGESSDVVALRYTKGQLTAWLGQAGFQVDRAWVEDVEGFPMKALYLEGSKT